MSGCEHGCEHVWSKGAIVSPTERPEEKHYFKACADCGLTVELSEAEWEQYCAQQRGETVQ